MSSHTKVLIASLAAIVIIVVSTMAFVVGPVVSNRSGGGNGGTTNINLTTSQCTTATAYIQVFNKNLTSPTGAPIQVNSVTLTAYPVGSTTPYATATSTATGTASMSGLGCNGQYQVVASNALNFLNSSILNVNKNAGPNLTIYMLPYKAPTITVANSPQATGAAQTVFNNAVAGGTATILTYVKSAGGGYDSQGPAALVFVANALNFPVGNNGGIVVAGASKIAAQLPTFSAVTTNTVYAVNYDQLGAQQGAYYAYVIPAAANGAWSTVSGPSNNQQPITTTFYTSSTFAGNEIVQQWWVPQDGYFNTGGPNAGKITQQYVNNNGAALISATGSANAIAISAQAVGLP